MVAIVVVQVAMVPELLVRLEAQVDAPKVPRVLAKVLSRHRASPCRQVPYSDRTVD